MNVRRATLRDADLLYWWRVDDERDEWWQTENSDIAKVTFESHLRWLEERLDNPAVILLVGLVDREPVGQARIDSNGELSFSIDKNHRGKGYGTQLVNAATHVAYQAGHTRVKACADYTNEAGIRTMLRVGYVLRPDVVFLRHPE